MLTLIFHHARAYTRNISLRWLSDDIFLMIYRYLFALLPPASFSFYDELER